MKRKFLAAVLAVTAFLSAFGTSSCQQGGEIIYTLSDDGKYYIVSGFSGNLEKAEILSKKDGLPVKEIGDRAFNGCFDLFQITIPDTIKTIGVMAFSGCYSLQSVTLPEGITQISVGTFFQCKSLQSITLPSTLKTISKQAFNDCDALKSIDLPNGLQSIDGLAFTDSGLTSITLPSTLTELGRGAFFCCLYLQSVTVGEGLTQLREGTFAFCPELTQIHLPKSLQYVAGHLDKTDENEELYSAFEYSPQITDVYYGGTSLDWSAVKVGKNNDYFSKAQFHYSDD